MDSILDTDSFDRASDWITDRKGNHFHLYHTGSRNCKYGSCTKSCMTVLVDLVIKHGNITLKDVRKRIIIMIHRTRGDNGHF